MTIEKLQSEVDIWIKEIGVRYFNELTNMGVLMEEVGELSRYMVRVYGEQSFKDEKDRLNIKEKIGEEIADILFVLTCLSNQMDIDLTSEIKRNLEKKTNRDHNRHKQNEKLT